MQFKPTLLALALAAASFGAQAGNLLSINITGGDFGMGAPSSLAGCAGTTYASHQCITAGNSNPINTADGKFEGPTLTNFNFFGSPVTTFTAASASGAAPSTDGNPLNGSVSGSTIGLDLGSFYANWNGTNFLQAPSDSSGALNPVVTGTWTSTGAGTGTFDIKWSSYITTAPFAGKTGYWEITGTGNIAAVPEASTYGMMVVGLGLVGAAVMRRRKV